MATGTKREPELNKSQELYDREFNRLTNTPENKALNDQMSATARESDASRHEVAGAEKQAIGDTAAGKVASTAAATFGGTVGKVAAKLAGKIKTKKGGAATGGIIGIIALLLIVATIAPSAILMNLKENGNNWLTRFSNITMDKRVKTTLEKRYFSDPASCKGVAIKCRFTPGMSDSEINKLKELGLVQDGDIAESGGKKYLKKMTFTDPKTGKVTSITKSNFRLFYGSNLEFNSRLRNVVGGKDILSRGKGAVKKMGLFGIDRKAPLGESGDEKTRLQKFRESFYGKKNTLPLTPGISEEDKTASGADPSQIEGLDNFDGINELADDLSANAVIDGPKTIIPDTNILSAIDPADVVVDGATKSIKGAFLGFFAAADSACTVYNMIRIANFAVKAYAARALIKYAGLFLTVADKQKDSEAATAEIGLLAGALLRPSREAASKGKDFSQSEGANLIFYGKVVKPESLARYSIGTTAMTALNAVYQFFNFDGTTATFCKDVKSWWGQTIMLIGGIITSIGTLGAGFVTGAIIGFTQALAFAYIQQVLIAQLVPVIAGTVTPDLKTDPEGGYGIGNALGAGMGAMGAELGKAVGMRPLTKAQVKRLAMTPEARLAAATDAYEKSQRGIFDSDNPGSIQNTLAITLSPLARLQQSAPVALANIGSVLSTAFNSPFKLAYADQTLLDSYKGEYCAEVKDDVLVSDPNIRDLARDANCNMLYSANPDTITDEGTRDATALASAGAWSIDVVLDYMIQHKHIDPNTGDALESPEVDSTETYVKFLESCVDGTDPLMDGYSADLEGAENPALCYEQSTMTDYYRTYTQLISAQLGVQAAADDKLGYAEAAAEQSTASTGSTNVGGMVWPIAKNDWPNKTNPILNCGLIYTTVAGRNGDVHTGIDMMTAYGKPVYAVTKGKITMKSPAWGAINLQTDLKDGTATLYANYQHLSKIVVSEGQNVNQGQLVGYVGYTGSGTISNSHLHFGVWTTNSFLSGRYPPDDPRSATTLANMRHPLNYLPEDGRNVSSCKKPYVVPSP